MVDTPTKIKSKDPAMNTNIGIENTTPDLFSHSHSYIYVSASRQGKGRKGKNAGRNGKEQQQQ